MFPDTANTPLLVTWLSTFGLVLALWTGAVMLWSRQRRERREQLRARLAEGGSAAAAGRRLRLWHEGEEAFTIVPGVPAPTLRLRLERLRADAGWRSPARNVLLGALALAAAAGAVTALWSGRLAPAVVVFAAVLLAFWWLTQRRILARDNLFERQLVDALELCSRALRAGHPLSGAFQLLAGEIPAPVGTVFAEINQQQAMGLGLQEALQRAAERTKSGDMKLFAASLAIHIQAGGNLADVMETLAGVIRERMRLNRRFRTLVAQTEFSKRILIVMPFLLFGLLNAISPDYTSTLYATGPGLVLLTVAAAGVLLGWLVMNRMTVSRT